MERIDKENTAGDWGRGEGERRGGDWGRHAKAARVMETNFAPDIFPGSS
jgi:hypothetical protein